MMKAGLVVFCMIVMSFVSTEENARVRTVLQDDSWTAPAWADTVKNPFAGQRDAALRGKEDFELYCWPCHGDKGKGDGSAGASFPVKPADFSKPVVTSQTDGAIFWKVSNGRGNMPAYSGMLEDDALWALVVYIRELSKQP